MTSTDGEGDGADTEPAGQGDTRRTHSFFSCCLSSRRLPCCRRPSYSLPLPRALPAVAHDELVVAGGTEAVAGAPHPEGGLPGQPAGERDGGGGRAVPRRHRRPLLGQAAGRLHRGGGHRAAVLTATRSRPNSARCSSLSRTPRPPPPPRRHPTRCRAMSAAEREDAPLVAHCTRPHGPGGGGVHHPRGGGRADQCAHRVADVDQSACRTAPSGR